MESSRDIAALREFGRAAQAAAAAMAINLTPLMAAFVKLGQETYAALWYHYILAGAPYGETHKGMERFWREVSERVRAKRKRETEDAWQQLVAEAKKWRNG